MSQGILFNLSVTFALVTGTAAGILALLSWEIFRASPFGKVVFAFTVVMATFALYHGVLLVVPSATVVTKFIESIIFTGLAVVTILVVRLQYRMQNTP